MRRYHFALAPAEGGAPRKLRDGDEVAVAPSGQYLVIVVTEQQKSDSEDEAAKAVQDAFKASPAAPEARFKVLSNEALSTLRRARQRYAASPLELGVLCARVGLLAEAERELQIASKQSPIAHRLLKQLP